MLTWFTGLGLWIKLAIVAAFLALIVGAVWYIHHSIWKSGYDAAEAVLKPQIAKLTTDLKNVSDDRDRVLDINKTFAAENKRLGEVVIGQNVQVQKFEADALAAQNKARAALAQVQREQANNARNRSEIARLEAIVSGPVITEGDCEEADSILRTLLRDRVPNDGTGPAPPASQPARVSH